MSAAVSGGMVAIGEQCAAWRRRGKRGFLCDPNNANKRHFGQGGLPLPACGQLLRTVLAAGRLRLRGDEKWVMSERRKILVLDPSGQMCGLSGLIMPDTEFFEASAVEAAARLLPVEQCGVGLVCFDSAGRPNGESVDKLIATAPATEWIAIVRPELLECGSFQSFMLRAFHDYHTMPIDVDRLSVTVGHAHGRARLRQRLSEGAQEAGRYGMIGASAPMRALYRQLDKVMNVDAAVLIMGESGTGKELAARAVHRHSGRAGGPFVVVNCGAIPGSLIQSELFGHEKGAFTGAVERKIGSIEAAHGGVLFLDEVADLSLDAQASLLRVLQERVITRVGSRQATPVDVRVIAATHFDLHQAMATGRFREDLYYRLNVIQLRIPPLRERVGDVSLLAQAALGRLLAANKHVRARDFTREALAAMNACDWPGNVRELVARVNRAGIMCDNRRIGAADLGLDGLAGDRATTTLGAARASFERDIVVAKLRENRNNISLTARQLGVSRVTLYRMMNRLNVRP